MILFFSFFWQILVVVESFNVELELEILIRKMHNSNSYYEIRKFFFSLKFLSTKKPIYEKNNIKNKIDIEFHALKRAKDNIDNEYFCSLYANEWSKNCFWETLWSNLISFNSDSCDTHYHDKENNNSEFEKGSIEEFILWPMDNIKDKAKHGSPYNTGNVIIRENLTS